MWPVSLRWIFYSSVSMICVQNGPLNCKNSSPKCTKNRYFETKMVNASSPAGTPPPHHTSPASAPSAPWLTPAALDHWVLPRVWKSGYSLWLPELVCGILSRSSCAIHTNGLSDNWREPFLENHEHGALWLLILGALEEHFTYLNNGFQA